MLEVNDFDAVRISLASPEQIRSWSYGEVTKPETINYRTLKPERDGLFCERIFGPTKDYECFCGKYKKVRFKGIICDKCGVEVARAKVRRERMGHIELASPVSHIWFAKGIPSRIGLLLDLSPRNLERVLYFSHYIITSINEDERNTAIAKLQADNVQESADRQQAVEAKIEADKETTVEKANQLRRDAVEEDEEAEDVATSEVERLRNMKRRNLLTENEYRDLSVKYPTLFEAEMGANAILKIIRDIQLDELRKELIEEGLSPSGQRRRKAGKRLQVVEAFRRSGNKPEWMIITVLPVLPPDLRPTVQLDGGRFAISDINDLYRRVINRNNRLRHLVEIGAPEIIVRNEKRMLQEAVDSLVDNGKRGQPVSVSGSHKLKSLSDMLRGKQGRFRQNLLGKRVDYSGRSVIVIGPELKLHQCGLPRRMALELFKPFVMRRLIEQGLAHNIKSARRQVEKAKPEVYDILEEVVKERPVLLNRAPTLHRLSIQAFEPVLIDGSAIQIHPLVCSAFNADFDGDQMAVHVPLSRAAVKGAREQMLSIHNMLLPSSGDPVVSPTLDMVLGCYYLTTIRPNALGTGKMFGSFEEAKLAFDLGAIDLKAEVEVRDLDGDGQRIKTTVGRIIFNECFPRAIGFRNGVVDKSSLKRIVADCARILNDEEMAGVMDRIKETGFKFATRSGTTIAMGDIEVPKAKAKLIASAEARTSEIEKQYEMGIITDEERYGEVVKIWNETTESVTRATQQNMDPLSGIYMMTTSGAKGNIIQIRQMAGMRGLMTNPSGRIIDFPIKASFSEGLSVLEYFISTHGARKGLADTALRTSESGYLTRRLVDVAHDVIIRELDCGSTTGLLIDETKDKELLPQLADRIIGRYPAVAIVDPKTGEVLISTDEEIDDKKAARVAAAGVKQVYVRSPMTCLAKQGVCQKCYGRDLARGNAVGMNSAVGIIAAQSIGEPGTQLTLRTFHTGGVVGLDITTGLPRVEELFEARSPKNQAVISEIAGIAEVVQTEERQVIRVTSSETFRDEHDLPPGWEATVQNGQWVEAGAVIAGPAPDKTVKKGKVTKAGKEAKVAKETVETVPPAEESQAVAPAEARALTAPVAGNVVVEDGRIAVVYEEKDERTYTVSGNTRLRVKTGEQVIAGRQLTEGQLNPQDILNVSGRDAVQRYLVDEVLKVYRSQGVNINDKHIEIIVRQMLAKVRVDSSGDTELVPGELVHLSKFEELNAKALAEGGEAAVAHPVLLGITRAALSTESWLAAASFQETTKVLTEAAIKRATDRLVGLKENVIIGRLIPARYKPDVEMLPVPAEIKAKFEEETAIDLDKDIDIDLDAEVDMELDTEGLPDDEDEPDEVS